MTTKWQRTLHGEWLKKKKTLYGNDKSTVPKWKLDQACTFMDWTRYYKVKPMVVMAAMKSWDSSHSGGLKSPRIISIGDSSTSSDTSLRMFLLLSPILVLVVRFMLFLEVLSTEVSILFIRKIMVLIFISELVNSESSFYLQKLQTLICVSWALRSQKLAQSMVPAPNHKVSDTTVSNFIVDLFFINKT